LMLERPPTYSMSPARCAPVTRPTVREAELFVRGTLLLGLILGAGTVLAQDPQPYAGLQHRSIKALSDQQIADLRAGRGMGLALAAELNGYPGPVHVIELADALSLTAEQRNRIAQLLETMRAQAVVLGERLIAQEQELDRQFAERTISPASLSAATAQIGQTQATLRAVHLNSHLAVIDILTADQIRRYVELRGYGGASTPGHQKRGDHHTAQ
jgi:Spy/CpxP family protein refolding chaperone